MKLGSLAIRPLWLLAMGTVLLSFGLFCAQQAWSMSRAATDIEQVHAAQRQASQAMSAELAGLRQQAMVALTALDPGAALADSATAATDLKRRLPALLKVEFYRGDLSEILHANYRSFGYAKAAQLMAAASVNGSPPVQSVAYGHGERRLSLVLPLGHTAPPLAWAWLELPFATLKQRFMAIKPGTGRLDLRQGDDHDSLRLLSYGAVSAQAEAIGMPIASSSFQVLAARPAVFIVLPCGKTMAAGLALFGIATGLYLFWLRIRLNRRLQSNSAEESFVAMSRPTLTPVPASPSVSSTANVLQSPPRAPRIDPAIFRAYDIRGIVGQSLSVDVAQLLGQSIGSTMREQGLREIVVGRDGRLSGPELATALTAGLRLAGVDVIDIGAVPTPVVYYAAYRYNTASGVAVTGSHNPPDYNGFKIVLGGETLAEDAIQALYRRMVEGRLESNGQGGLRSIDVVPDYAERIGNDVQTARSLKVVIDCGNGIPGAVAPQVLQRIGCEVLPLYCEVDGHFPNHHPDPSDPHNLEDLILAVKQTGADLGLAFDGDGDRLGVVTRQGEIVFPDRTLMLFARDVLSRRPGATIIYDVKCTGHLHRQILDAAGRPLMWRTGHSLIKAKMRETGAELAGEMSGHFFFKERWYGFDDGIYAAARLLEILAGDPAERSVEEIFASCPKGVSTPELKIEMAEGEHYRFMEKFVARATFVDANLITIDGVRADWPDGWGLVRPSNTTPVLVLRFDADDDVALARIKQVFREQLLAVEPTLKLPF